MKTKTFKERLEAGLRALGYAQVHSHTQKYTSWMHPDLPADRTLFVGPNGALRVGRCASKSVSMCDAASYNWAREQNRWSPSSSAYKRILEHGDGQLMVPL